MDLPDGLTLAAALDLFYASHPGLIPHRATARTAVGTEYAPSDSILSPGNEVSLIPPVQGG